MSKESISDTRTRKEKESPKYLGMVMNVTEAIERLGLARKGDAVGMEIEAGSFQQRDEFVNDFKQEFRRLKLKVKLSTTIMLDRPRGFYLMTITKDPG